MEIIVGLLIFTLGYIVFTMIFPSSSEGEKPDSSDYNYKEIEIPIVVQIASRQKKMYHSEQASSGKYCYACKRYFPEKKEICGTCGWVKCSCGACGCKYRGRYRR